MAGRTVSVTLQAKIDGYLASMNRAADATKGFASKASGYVDKHEQSINKLSNTAGLLGAGLAAGVVVAVKSAADFDKAMSSVAASGDDARNNLGALRDAAIKAGADTKYSAGEAAAGIESLAKAGVSAKDTLGGGLSGALNLAAAGNLSVADSAEAAATAMTQFHLSGKDVPHIADLLAAGAGKAQGEVSDMAAALKQSGLVASQFGLSIEDTTGSLAAFASAGLIGSDAGTSFKSMLLALANPSKQSADLMKKLGVNAYDTQGAFVGVTGLAQQLHDKLGNLTEAQRNAALAQIFGTDAIRAANVLYDQGADGIQGWIDQVNDSGFAAQTAATKMDNLSGDVEQLKGSFETAMIGLGEGAQGPLRDVVQALTDVVNGFNDLSSGSKQTVLIVGAALAGIALGAAGIGKVATFANDARLALKGLGISAGAASIAMVGVTAAVGVGAAVYAHYAAQQAQAKQAVDDYVTALQSQTDAIRQNVTAVAAKNLSDSGALESARKLGLNLDDVTQAALGNSSAMARLTPQLDAADAAWRATAGSAKDSGDVWFQAADKASGGSADLADAADKVRSAIGGQSTAFGDAVQKAKDLAEANKSATQSTQPSVYQQAATALAALKTQSSGAAAEVTRLTDAMFASANAALELSGSQIGFEAAIDAATAAAKKNGKILDTNKEKGRENKQALDNLATASLKYIDTQIKQGSSTEDLKKSTQRAHDKFVDTAIAMGKTSTQAEALAKKYGLVPKKVQTKAEMQAEQAKSEAKKVQNAIKDIPPKKQAEILSIFQRSGYDAAITALNNADGKTATTYIRTVHVITTQQSTGTTGTGKKPGLATGGKLVGPGTSTSDSIPIWGSRDEWMINAKASQHYGDAAMAALNSMAIPKDAFNGFANGGKLGPLVGYASGGKIDVDALWRLITAVTDPLKLVADATSKVAKAQAELNAANRKIAHPTAVLARADRAHDRAVDERDDIKDRVNRLAREAAATKGTTKADRDLRKARLDLAEANTRVTKTSHAKTEAQKAYDKVAGPAKKAAQALKDAQKELADQQKAVADSARQVAATFRDAFTSDSTDPFAWLTKMREGAGDVAKFTAQLDKLRKQGLSESLIQQLVSMGAVNGGAAAAQISGNSGLIKALNQASSQLSTAADKLGYFAAVGKHATGGLISGPGGPTGDKVPIMASDGEVMIRTWAANRLGVDNLLRANETGQWPGMKDGGRVVVERNFAAGSNSYSGGRSVIDHQAVRSALAGMRITGELQLVNGHAYIEGIAVDVMERETGRAAGAF